VGSGTRPAQTKNKQKKVYISCTHFYDSVTATNFSENRQNEKNENENRLIYEIERIHNEGPLTSFKLLGVLLDEYLSFDDHINSLCTKISKSLFCINRVKNFVNQETKKTLYFAMVHSHLSYCLNVYSSANSTSLNRLILKQKEAIRIVCNTGFREHTAPLFKQLKILPLNELIHLSKLKFMHSFYHNILPESFNRMWLSNRERYPERVLRNADQLYIPAHNYATLKRLPKFNLPLYGTLLVMRNLILFSFNFKSC
jgi:hypothetical protein